MSLFKKSYINFGWLNDRAVYLNTKSQEFYLTDIRKNSNGIMLLGPVMSSISYTFFQTIGTSLGIVDNFTFRIIMLGLVIILSMIFRIGTVQFVRSKANFTSYQISGNQLTEIVRSANLQNKAIQIVCSK